MPKEPEPNTHPRPSAGHPRSSEPALSRAEGLKRPRSRRGGRRTGAGAPRGNLNTLKHGRHSTQFAALGALVVTNPTVREALLAWGVRHDLTNQKLEDLATHFFDRLMTHARDIAEGKPSPAPSPASSTTPNQKSATNERPRDQFRAFCAVSGPPSIIHLCPSVPSVAQTSLPSPAHGRGVGGEGLKNSIPYS